MLMVLLCIYERCGLASGHRVLWPVEAFPLSKTRLYGPACARSVKSARPYERVTRPYVRMTRAYVALTNARPRRGSSRAAKTRLIARDRPKRAADLSALKLGT